MRVGPDQVGWRGLLLLGVAGVVGVLLAVHGYGQDAVNPATNAPSSISTTAPSHAHKPGPFRSLTKDAHFAGQVDPKTETARASVATSGLNVQVISGATTIMVHVSTAGSSSAQTATYALEDRVDHVEATVGGDARVTDDGPAVTYPPARGVA